MKYMGSKRRIKKHILPIIEELRQNRLYIEPFVGGANIFQDVKGPKIGYDSHPYLIAMWQAVSNGWLPPQDITEEQYYYIRNNKDENPTLTGYVGFALSYGGKWFGGWCRDSLGKRDYVRESYNNALKQFPLLRGVKFECETVFNLNPTEPSLIYCDPPYQNTTRYKDQFNHSQFFDWCQNMSDRGHIVLISEYDTPFKCIWEKPVTSSLTRDTGSKQAIERLFVV